MWTKGSCTNTHFRVISQVYPPYFHNFSSTLRNILYLYLRIEVWLRYPNYFWQEEGWVNKYIQTSSAHNILRKPTIRYLSTPLGEPPDSQNVDSLVHETQTNKSMKDLLVHVTKTCWSLRGGTAGPRKEDLLVHKT